MQVVTLDVPIAILVVLVLAIAGLRGGYRRLVVIGQAAATFAAGFSLGVNWSIGRILPLVIAPYGLRRRPSGLKDFAPFALYAVTATAIGSLFWQVPTGIAFAYGEGRAGVQLFNFTMLVFAARATAFALCDKRAIEMLWWSLTIAVIVHGLASIYQLIATTAGLPLIGISRPFGLTAGEASGDVAAFVTKGGESLYRPGGLAGEPKTVAVVYGIYVIAFAFGGYHLTGRVLGSRAWLAYVAFLLSIIGFVAAFSTSAIFGLLVALPIAAVLLGTGRRRRVLLVAPIALSAGLLIWMYLTDVNSLDSVVAILGERTTGRIEDDELDAPVQASLDTIASNPLVALFGVGLGGSSFLTMAFVGEAFEYSFAPNIGLVLLLVELGVVGCGLLLWPLASRIRRAAKSARRDREPHRSLLVAVAISACVLCLAGSGIPLGLALAVGAAGAAVRLLVDTKAAVSYQQGGAA